LFFSRQVGLFLLPLVLAWVSIGLPRRGKYLRSQAAKKSLAVILGFLLLFAPYATLLYQQSGQTPFSQHFRSAPPPPIPDDPRVLLELAQPSTAAEATSYSEILSGRRQLRRLLPDNSATYADVVGTSRATPAGPNQHLLKQTAESALAYARRVRDNLNYLRLITGDLIFGLFVLSFLSVLLFRSDRVTTRERYFVGITVMAYISLISLFSSLVSRYIFVIAPLAIIQVASELALVGQVIFSNRRPSYLRKALSLSLAASLLIAAAWSTPRKFSDLKLVVQSAVISPQFERFQRIIPTGAPVLGLFPFDSFAAGDK